MTVKILLIFDYIKHEVSNINVSHEIFWHMLQCLFSLFMKSKIIVLFSNYAEQSSNVNMSLERIR